MKQIPFTKTQFAQLLANAKTGAATGDTAPPVVKFFCPWGAATWLICEAEPHDGSFDVRCQTRYSQHFTGVSYFPLEHFKPDHPSWMAGEAKA
jgi:hypothetical protein